MNNLHKPNEIIEVDGKKVAIDRSVGVTILVYSIGKDGQRYILCNKRGSTKRDSGGLWNIPSGYLDWGETAEECAIREVYEECGIDISKLVLKQSEVSTDPKEHNQNVIFRFVALDDENLMNCTLHTQHSEEGEVDDVKWIPWKDIDKYQFAWNQLSTIKRLMDKEFNFLNNGM